MSRNKYCVSIEAAPPSDFIPYLLDDLGKGKSCECTDGVIALLTSNEPGPVIRWRNFLSRTLCSTAPDKLTPRT